MSAAIEASYAAADRARASLVLRYARHHGPRQVPGEAPSAWSDRFRAFEAEVKAWTDRLSVAQVIEQHQLLDYAKWRVGDDDR